MRHELLKVTFCLMVCVMTNFMENLRICVVKFIVENSEFLGNENGRIVILNFFDIYFVSSTKVTHNLLTRLTKNCLSSHEIRYNINLFENATKGEKMSGFFRCFVFKNVGISNLNFMVKWTLHGEIVQTN